MRVLALGILVNFLILAATPVLGLNHATALGLRGLLYAMATVSILARVNGSGWMILPMLVSFFWLQDGSTTVSLLGHGCGIAAGINAYSVWHRKRSKP